MNKEIFAGMNRELKAMIFKEAHDTGEPVAKIAAKYTLPDIAVLNDEGKFNYQDRMITVEEWRAINPLGEYGKIVTIN
jgi:hypothetical protein